jgi:predicted site-specific integrase-resolvase
MNVPEGYVPNSTASRILKVSSTTLRKWADAGTIHYYRSGEEGTKRWYNVKEFLSRNATDQHTADPKPERARIIYARISTRNQRDDLERQCSYLRTRYPNHKLITDTGSGLNYKRRGLKTILELAIKGDLEELVVAHKDRLCRFGFELFEWIVSTYSKGKIVVLNNHKSSPETELCKDIISIITVFGARVNGLRKYKPMLEKEWEESKDDKSKNTPNEDPEKDTE